MDSGSSTGTTRRRMRSSAVALGGMGLLAASLVACGSSDAPDKRCVSKTSLDKLDDKECRSGGRGSYYYGGTTSNGRVTGGSFDKSAVSRGGIGGGGGSHKSSGG
ncbi:hypothetical protein ABT084_22630 [Streptomyces sp. NPDC002138]|uniref:hypothetical protein n=1 Tax=Streptomyces sp. NPDC002138 TaxID=3154410 RepID=UPI00331756AC